MEYAIRVEGLSRTFVSRPSYLDRLRKKGKTRRVDALVDVNLNVHEGELFGLLGPNGAGKTTLIKILCTLLLPTKGRAFVGGFDVVKESFRVKEIINMVAGGERSGYGILTVRENIWMFSQLYGIPSKVAYERVDTLLKLVGLEERADERVHKLSTGETQKMNVCRGFVTDPKILFLDEPTIGLDVEVSRTIRSFIKRWIREQTDRTIMLTTHYMAEAEELCDRIAIINEGRIVACDTPDALKKMVKKTSIFNIRTGTLHNRRILESIKGVKTLDLKHNIADNTTMIRIGLEEEGVIADVVSALTANHMKILHLSKDEPTLEDVFIHLCGRGLHDETTPSG